MASNNTLLRRFYSKEVGAGPRLIALGFAIANIPTLLLALVAFFFLPITIPGIILYIFYWQSARDKLSWERTKALWVWTLVYNLILFVVGAAIVISDPDPGGLILLLPGLAAAMAGIAIVSLDEHKELREEGDRAGSIAITTVNDIFVEGNREDTLEWEGANKKIVE
ncbi:MAG: hypothetical protein NWR72_10200 [Bacteroidia bacterium]|nr:hypothetical protein [Bacteroidia bacterium]